MKNLKICLSDGTFDGIVHMYSGSAFSAIRIPRADLPLYKKELSNIGLYMLLIDNDEVYVGQSGQPLIERILSAHSGDIDRKWHTLVAFPCNNPLHDNELLFIENALCEYAHNHCPLCVTNVPSRDHCTEKYRKDHYRLKPIEIDTCNEFVADIEFYISNLRDSHFNTCFIATNMHCPVRKELCSTRTKENDFASTASISTESEKQHGIYTFYFHNKRRDAHATLEVHIRSGEVVRTILKKGTRISRGFVDCCRNKEALQERRLKYEHDGKIRDRVLLEDIIWDEPSPNDVLYFVNAASNDALEDWKSSSGKPLGTYLSQ